jgi:hypothetical protein
MPRINPVNPESSDAKTAATLQVVKVTRSRAEISDADLTAVREGGLDDGLIVEIIANVAMNVMTNYLNKVADTEIDFPLVELKAAA